MKFNWPTNFSFSFSILETRYLRCIGDCGQVVGTDPVWVHHMEASGSQSSDSSPQQLAEAVASGGGSSGSSSSLGQARWFRNATTVGVSWILHFIFWFRESSIISTDIAVDSFNPFGQQNQIAFLVQYSHIVACDYNVLLLLQFLSILHNR